jgi:hypothetical protein
VPRGGWRGQPFDEINVQRPLGPDARSFDQLRDLPVTLCDLLTLDLVDVLSALDDAVAMANSSGTWAG